MNLKEIALANIEEAGNYFSSFSLPLGLKQKSEDEPDRPVKRATATLLRLRDRDVFVTCCHVVEEFRRMQEADPAASLVGYHVGNLQFTELHGFELLDWERKSLDVAVLGGQEPAVEISGRKFLKYPACYLTDPRADEACVIAGYPGANVRIKQRKADFGFMYLVLRVSSVSERQLVLADTHGTRRFNDVDDPTLTGVDLGGLSGSPAFVIRDGHPRFVGIVTECPPGEDCTKHTIMVSRLGCILPDGMLDHLSIPW